MKKILLVVWLLGAVVMHSQDIRAAYIRTKLLSGSTQSITVTLFTDGALMVFRPFVPINFGDGNYGTLTMLSAGSVPGSGTVKKVYSGTHTYAGAGSYWASFQDTFRVAGIRNINNSQTQAIFVDALMVIGNNSQQNTCPVMLNEPLNFGVTGSQFFYMPAYTDTDGDSLSFSLVNCIGAGYYRPANTSINNSGLFSFYSDTVGSYAFSIVTKEWRKNTNGLYAVIGTTQMDFVTELSIPSGIKAEGAHDLKLSLCPNPVVGRLQIASNKVGSGTFLIEIINDLGQIVLTEANHNNIDVSDLPSGSYLLILRETDSKPCCARFIKQ
jgi:hypothetical protein